MLLAHYSQPVLAQVQPNLSPIYLSQAVPPPNFIPTDLTPVGIGQEQELIRPGFRFYLLQKLPAKVWFNSTTEVDQRLDTNAFMTANKPKADYVFRVLPNITLGYNFHGNTSVYCNYFMIRDDYAVHPILNRATTQSIGWGLRHQIPIGAKTNIQLDLLCRELFQARDLQQGDIIPGITITRVTSPRECRFHEFAIADAGARLYGCPNQRTRSVLHNRSAV